MKTVLVTGATGFVGHAVATGFYRHGWYVAAAGRKRTPGPWHCFLEFTLPWDPVPAFPAGIDAVVHAAGIAHDTGDTVSCDMYDAVNAAGSLAVALAAKAASARHFVLISSVRAMADRTFGVPLTEASPCHPTTDYGRSKLRAEHLVSEALASTSCRLAILRLTPVYGPGAKGNLARLIRWAGRSWFPHLPEGVGGRSMVHIGDFVDLLTLILLGGFHGTGIVDDGIVYTPRAIQDSIRSSSRTVLPFTVSASAVDRWAASLAKVPLLRNYATIALDARRLLADACYNGTSLRKLTGFEPRRSLWSELERGETSARF